MTFAMTGLMSWASSKKMMSALRLSPEVVFVKSGFDSAHILVMCEKFSLRRPSSALMSSHAFSA